MRRGGKLEPAADHRAVQHRDDRHAAELDALEGAMPGPRMLDAGEGVALGQFGQIEPGAEMLALAGEHDGADVLRQRAEESLDAAHGRIVERVALLARDEPQHRDRAVALGLQASAAGRRIRLRGHGHCSCLAPFDPFRRGP